MRSIVMLSYAKMRSIIIMQRSMITNSCEALLLFLLHCNIVTTIFYTRAIDFLLISAGSVVGYQQFENATLSKSNSLLLHQLSYTKFLAPSFYYYEK